VSRTGLFGPRSRGVTGRHLRRAVLVGLDLGEDDLRAPLEGALFLGCRPPTLDAMTSPDASPHAETLGLLGRQSDHRDVERTLLQEGWRPCGAGDWAIALRSPDSTAAARISPFDPTGPYSADLYRQAAQTRQVPALFAHRRLTGGGDLQVMEWLEPVPEDEATGFHQAIAEPSPDVADLADVVRRVHQRARRELPWCGPLDHNPANVMRAVDGRLVVTDLFYADGQDLYATAESDPDLVVARIPEAERRFMTEIPLATSGPWAPTARAAMRAGLAAADVRMAASR
jgi:hypothetical protein